jgi:hypothetical protein
MKMFDADNNIGTPLNARQAAEIKAAMDAGTILDVSRQPLTWDDCLDRDGDLCLDEDSYDAALSIAKATH